MSDDSRDLLDVEPSLRWHQTQPHTGKDEASLSPSNAAVVNDQSINRKWVKQMKKRIREFVSNSSHVGTGSASELTNCSELIPTLDTSSTHPLTSQLVVDMTRTCRNFGVRLDKCEPSSISLYIPVVIEICTRLIELHVNDEGLYRKVGQKQVVASLRTQLNNGVMQINIADINWNNPHAVVSLLKSFLNQLPDSLTTSRLYPEFIRVCRVESHSMRLNLIKQLLGRLPRHNYETLKYLCAHLRRVATAYQHNKMTIKNLCIAFSQSIIRHNDANCETIKSDHLLQSQLMELILIYYDWLFDPSQTSQIPEEIKEPCEQHLFQQYCFHNLPLNYADMLSNILKSLKSNRTSAYFSTCNFQMSQIKSMSPLPLKSEAAMLNKGMLVRNAKSIGNMPRCKQSDYSKKEVPSSSRSQKQAAKSTTKHRSKSVDVRLKSLFCTTNHSIDSRAYKKSLPSPPKSSQDDNRLAKDKSLPNRTSCVIRFTNPLKSAPLTRKSYDSLTWCETDGHFGRLSENKNESAAPLIDFKQLEKKNELERQRLSEIMAKLELDLAQAKKELMEDDLDFNLSPFFKKPTNQTDMVTSPLKTKPCLGHANQVLSNSNGRSTSSLSSSGVSPAVVKINSPRTDHAKRECSTDCQLKQVATKLKPNLMLQSPSSSTSSSDEFMVVSPKLNRTRPQADKIAPTCQAKCFSKPNAVPLRLNNRATVTRRHTIAFGSCEPAASTPSIRFLRNLKQVNIETTSAEVVKLLRRQQKMRMRIMGSKSATNLLSGATVLTVASDPTGGSLVSHATLKSPAMVPNDDEQKAVKKTILNLSPLSISASSVSSSSANSNETHQSNSHSSRSSLISESRERGAGGSSVGAVASAKVFVTSLADEVGSVSQMYPLPSDTSTNTQKLLMPNEGTLAENNVPGTSATLGLKVCSKYESLI